MRNKLLIAALVVVGQRHVDPAGARVRLHVLGAVHLRRPDDVRGLARVDQDLGAAETGHERARGPVGPGLDQREPLAAPVGAPWLKIGEAMDYVLAVAPARSFAVHDLPLSEVGLQMQRARIAWATEQGGGAFVALEPGDTLEL